ncbi:MAG: hypothetical protein QM803_08925 [Rhodocyclaceae bacterium]
MPLELLELTEELLLEDDEATLEELLDTLLDDAEELDLLDELLDAALLLEDEDDELEDAGPYEQYLADLLGFGSTPPKLLSTHVTLLVNVPYTKSPAAP